MQYRLTLALTIALGATLLAVAPALAAKATRVVILEFEGPGKTGKQLADAIETELELAEGVLLVPRGKVASELRGGRISATALARAMAKANVDVVVAGQSRRGGSGPVVEVAAYNREGLSIFSEVFTGNEVDTLAVSIADALKEVIAKGTAFERRTPPPATVAAADSDEDGADGAGRSTAPPPRSGATERRPGRSEADDWDRRSAPAPAPTPPPQRSRFDDESSTPPARGRLDDEEPGEASEPAVLGWPLGGRAGVRGQIPYADFAAAGDLIYWSYAATPQGAGPVKVGYKLGDGAIPVDPVAPAVGGSLRIETWPILYAGAEAQGRMGSAWVAFAKESGLQEKVVQILLYEAQLHLRGRYVLETGWPGTAFGARLGYRLLMANAAGQHPYTVVPSFTGHLLTPGIEARVPLHRRYAILDVSAELVPWGLYSETPDTPGDPTTAGLFGWRVDLRLHGNIAYGAFVELRGHWQEYGITFTGTGSRSDQNSNVYRDGKVTVGSRGLALGVGWAY